MKWGAIKLNDRNQGMSGIEVAASLNLDGVERDDSGNLTVEELCYFQGLQLPIFGAQECRILRLVEPPASVVQDAVDSIDYGPFSCKLAKIATRNLVVPDRRLAIVGFFESEVEKQLGELRRRFVREIYGKIVKNRFHRFNSNPFLILSCVPDRGQSRGSLYDSMPNVWNLTGQEILFDPPQRLAN